MRRYFFDTISSWLGDVWIVFTEQNGPLVVRVILGQSEEPPQAEPRALPEQIRQAFVEYFNGNARSIDVAFVLEGPPFFKKVWLKTRQIPYGQRRTYRWVAEAVGCPSGARAVGQALHRNPLPLIIPCHRVVGSDGRLVGFSSGLQLKEALLRFEAEVAGSSFRS